MLGRGEIQKRFSARLETFSSQGAQLPSIYMERPTLYSDSAALTRPNEEQDCAGGREWSRQEWFEGPSGEGGPAV